MTLVYLLAGETSGDVLGARLMASLKARQPGIRFAGVGGPRMAAEGQESLFPMRELAVMGLVEILPRLHRLRALLHATVEDVRARRPDIVVTIDSPGFCMHLLRAIGPGGPKRVHYVAPQVWAWREHRVRSYPGLWDRLLCLLPFEPAYFGRHGLEARFVGHPVLQSGADLGDAGRFRAAHGLAAAQEVLVLMPGSRRSEVPKLLPVFGRTLALLARLRPGLVPVVPTAATVAETVQRATAAWPVQPILVTGLTEKHDAYAAAGAALTKSGTSTLELALAGVPMAVTYRVNPLSAMIARRLIRVEHVAMVNLLAGRRLVPELLQQDCRPALLAKTAAGLLDDQAARTAQRAGFADVLASLRAPCGRSPSDEAAEQVLSLLS